MTKKRALPECREVTNEPKPEGLAKWVILVYQAADNNLSEECVYQLNEMKKAYSEVIEMKGPGAKKGTAVDPGLRPVEIIVQLDPFGRGNATRRFRINNPTNDDETNPLKGDVIWCGRETNTGSSRALLRFLKWGIKRFNAEHYMVVLTGHGAGIFEGFFLQDETIPLSALPSSFPIRNLNDVFGDKKLKKALGERKIDILGFDACLMSMLEVCDQLLAKKTKNSDKSVKEDKDEKPVILDLIVGSEGFTLNAGWPYAGLLDELKKSNFVLTPLELAHRIAERYIRFYKEYYLGGLSVDISIIHLHRIHLLRQKVGDLARALISELSPEPLTKAESDDDGEYDPTGEPFQDALLLSHWAAQSYNGERCVDLYDFCDLLRERLCKNSNDKDCHDDAKTSASNSVIARCKQVMDQIERLDNKVVEKSCYVGSAFQYSHGISIYFPWSQRDFDPTYESLAFGKSRWADFLKLYLKKTKRPARDDEKARDYEKGSKRPNLLEGGRATPPGNKGTDGKVYSMRNPATAFRQTTCEESGK